ncbi:MAG: cellobiose phosphorylase [Anaerolineae bacterium]|jgi:cellobiose phosphorylase
MSDRRHDSGWTFLDQNGTFTLRDPHKTSYLYFPLVNEAGMISAVTPLLHGDAKTSQNSFLLTPVSVEDLHTSRSARNFWVIVDGEPWSATGNSARQIAHDFVDDDAEQVTLEAGFLWHRVTRKSPQVGLRAETTSFVPASDDAVELMQVVLTNVADRPLTVTPTAAIPIYGRSADNLRDHRHVTSLLHRIPTQRYGVLVRPTLSFDERGHRPNTVTYAVLGVEGEGRPPVAFSPVLEAFVGEGGTLDWPKGVIAPDDERWGAGEAMAGSEAMGGLHFQAIRLDPGESRAYVLILAIIDDHAEPETLVQRYGDQRQFNAWLTRTKAHWEQKLGVAQVDAGNRRFDLWMKWVTVQPILRRICGNSFLPYHDYGRGGRGWRDLWQDSLVLLMMEPDNVGDLLWSYYAGVRTDGSNATIIGSEPGEFIADRNNIPRVWMDHGAWPLLTTELYIDWSGDLAFLLRDQSYFRDPWLRRAQAVDETWRPAEGTQLKTASGDVYRGTVLEHLLVQHLTAFFNVGQHNLIRLEGADWNDGLDMAQERGESAAFTALYASNLRLLSHMILQLSRLGVERVHLLSELTLLLDTLTDPLDYASVAAKRTRLDAYFAVTERIVSGEKTAVTLKDLSRDLAAKADWLYAHLREQEWLEGEDRAGWFNGYYDEDGQRLEGEHPGGARMTLTGQVFTLMGGVATDEQAQKIVRAADRYLYDEVVGGYRLNNDFGDAAARLSTRLGRCFGFAFGHKENGAMFSHMAVMYANALYQRGLVREGFNVLDGIYRHSQDFAVSRMYPGIPEYVGPTGRGMYPYLTGSASWYLLTMLTQVFGVKGSLGDLMLEPKLVRQQFNSDGRASAVTLFAGRRLRVVYHNPRRLDYGQYRIKELRVDDRPTEFRRRGNAVVLPRELIAELVDGAVHPLEVILAEV